MFNIDIEKLFYLFKYDQNDPLIFTTSLFLFLFFLLLILYRFVYDKKNLRIILLLAFSFFFYYKVSGFFFLILIFTSVYNYYFAIRIESSKSKTLKRAYFLSAVTINLLLLGYFKYTNFFIRILNDLKSGSIEFIDIILPIGISFYTFKAISYIIDVYRETLKPEKNFLDFALYISFFANVLAGPIDRAGEFIPQTKKNVFISKADMGIAVYLIISGLFKKMVIADYISINFVDRVFDSPLRFTGFENLAAVYGYALQIYCDFSGYSDLAIGIALLLGIKLMENFNSPYKAVSIADFWRRWHISLSRWLLDYLFKPIQIRLRNFRIFANAAALLITFALCGLWHGADWTFIFWGFLHGFFMTFSLFISKPKNKFYKKFRLQDLPAGGQGSKLLKVGKIFITFNLVAFAWVFFRANSFETALNVFDQIINFFHGEVALQFIEAFKGVTILILIGYILHFLPKSFEIKTQNILAKLPVFAQALLLAVMIFIAAQVRSADLQPFIYFQF